MSQTFPLYEQLCETVTKNTNLPDWKTLSFTINSLTPEQCEIIFALIYHHHQLGNENKGSSFRIKKEPGLPYGGKPFEGGKGVLYTATSFPPILQNIINEYVKMIV